MYYVYFWPLEGGLVETVAKKTTFENRKGAKSSHIICLCQDQMSARSQPTALRGYDQTIESHFLVPTELFSKRNRQPRNDKQWSQNTVTWKNTKNIDYGSNCHAEHIKTI